MVIEILFEYFDLLTSPAAFAPRTAPLRTPSPLTLSRWPRRCIWMASWPRSRCASLCKVSPLATTPPKSSGDWRYLAPLYIKPPIRAKQKHTQHPQNTIYLLVFFTSKQSNKCNESHERHNKKWNPLDLLCLPILTMITYNFTAYILYIHCTHTQKVCT